MKLLTLICVTLFSITGCAVHKSARLPLNNKVSMRFHGISLAGTCQISHVTFNAKDKSYDVYCERDDNPYPHF